MKDYLMYNNTLLIFSPKHRNKLYVLVLIFLFSIGGCKKAESGELQAMVDASAAINHLTTGKEVSRQAQERETDPLFGKPKQPELRIEYEPLDNYTKADVFEEIVGVLKKDGWVSSSDRSGYFTASLQQGYYTILAEVLLRSNDNIVSVIFVTIPR